MNLKNLIVPVDVQNDFVSGVLGCKENVIITEKIKGCLEKWSGTAGTIIMATKDTHESDYLHTREGRRLPVEHCLAFTDGWDSPLDEYFDGHTDKDTFMANSLHFYEDLKLVARMNRDLDIDDIDDTDEINIYVMGFCTSICVISNALMLRHLFPEANVYLVSDLCNDLTEENHNAALVVAKSCHIDVIESKDMMANVPSK